MLQNCQSPPSLVDRFGSRWICWFHLDPLVSTQVFQRDRAQSTPSLDRHRATLLVGQKIFHCPKQIRTKPSFFLADGIQTSALQELSEKPLGNILCCLSPNALSPNEAINWAPIGAAKLLQRLLCRWRFPLCLQHHAPVRGRKRYRARIGASANPAQ